MKLKMMTLLLSMMLFSTVAKAEYIVTVTFDFRQADSFKKVSSFLFWRSYKGIPSILEVEDTVTGHVMDVDVRHKEVKVVLNKDCYKKIKSVVKGDVPYNNYYLVIQGKLDELKIKPDKKGKVKIKQNNITSCEFREHI